jgi:hypothetical protein
MNNRRISRIPAIAAVLVAAGLVLGGCNSTPKAPPGPREAEQARQDEGGGFRIPGFGGGNTNRDVTEERVEGIGVNSLLWRASLDTISFMPLATTDPYGGVITTEWYNNPEVINERFKVSVFILDTRLRADAVKVSVSRQNLTANGWMEGAVSADTGLAIENAILTRARQLRLANLPN